MKREMNDHSVAQCQELYTPAEELEDNDGDHWQGILEKGVVARMIGLDPNRPKPACIQE
jgi:hypothetical protein